jgi:hypothetical protein
MRTRLLTSGVLVIAGVGLLWASSPRSDVPSTAAPAHRPASAALAMAPALPLSGTDAAGPEPVTGTAPPAVVLSNRIAPPDHRTEFGGTVWFHPCDYNRDRVLDATDFAEFQREFIGGGWRADQNNDRVVDVRDLVEFVDRFQNLQWASIPVCFDDRQTDDGSRGCRDLWRDRYAERLMKMG